MAVFGLAACTTAPVPAPAPVAAPAPFPAVTLLRVQLGPHGLIPRDSANLYLYLLIGSHEADNAKVLAAFSAYLCEIRPDRPEVSENLRRSGTNIGLYIVPVTSATQYAGSDASQLMRVYDFDRANDLLVGLVRNSVMQRRDLTPTGIYLAGFDAPLPNTSTKQAVFEISHLSTPRDVRNWLVAEEESLELGEVTPTNGVTRVPPSLRMILQGFGENIQTFAHITTAANASETIPCR